MCFHANLTVEYCRCTSISQVLKRNIKIVKVIAVLFVFISITRIYMHACAFMLILQKHIVDNFQIHLHPKFEREI